MADLSKEEAYAFAVRWPGEEKYYMSYETDSGWCRQIYETRNDSQFILVPEDKPRKNVFLVQNVYPDSKKDQWLSYSGDNLRVGLYSAKSDASPWEFVRTDNSYKLKCLYEGQGKNKWLSFTWDGRWNYLYTNESDACPYELISVDRESPLTIKIMTFNIWRDGEKGGQPLSQTAKAIQMGNADIVGLQEVPQNAKAIAERLGWNHVQQFGNTAVLSRFKIIETTTNKLGVKIRTDFGQVIFLFNVHLPAYPYQPYQLLEIPHGNDPFLNTEEEAIAAAQSARGDQVNELLEEVSNIEDKKTPVFITGDFNEPSHLDWTQAAAKLRTHPLKVSYPTSSVLTRAGFIDAYRAVHPDEIKKPGYTWTPTTKPDDQYDHHDRIDFVLCRSHNVKIEDAKIVGENRKNADIVVNPYPSDHRALVAKFTINK